MCNTLYSSMYCTGEQASYDPANQSATSEPAEIARPAHRNAF